MKGKVPGSYLLAPRIKNRPSSAAALFPRVNAAQAKEPTRPEIAVKITFAENPRSRSSQIVLNLGAKESYFRAGNSNVFQLTLVEAESVYRQLLQIAVRRFSEETVDKLQAVRGNDDLDAAVNRAENCGTDRAMAAGC